MNHESPMQEALELARKAWGLTHPNPMVGAVIVENGEIVAEGYHAAAGQDHAEVAALKRLGRPPAADACLYVTLEPCSTTGRTGACTDTIRQSGIGKVVIGTTDPNPAHAGRGLRILRDAGIEVTEGILEAKCRDLNLVFNHWITAKRPLIAGKIATTLDGRVATRTGDSKWITNAASRADGHRWRSLFPGIASGSGSILADDPALTSRLGGEPTRCGRRFVFDRSLATLERPHLKVYSDAHRDQTTVLTLDCHSRETLDNITGQGIQLWPLPREHFLKEFVRHCTAEAVTGVLIEGGPTLISAFLAEGLLDYLFAYRAPRFLADSDARACLSGQSIGLMADAFHLDEVQLAHFDGDQLMRGRVHHASLQKKC